MAGFMDGGFGGLVGAAANIIGGIMGQNSAENTAANNISNQVRFARNAIQWKVRDAKDAGVHPLFALGAPTTSFSNVSSSNALGEGIAAAGQDLGRAVNAFSSQEEKAMTIAGAKLELEGKQIDNDIKRATLADLTRRTLAPGSPPSLNDRFLVDGQNSAAAVNPLVKVSPMKQTANQPGVPHIEPGANPAVGYARTKTGWMPIPGQQVKEQIEDSPLEWAWMASNVLGPMFGANESPPPFPAPKGYVWGMNPLTFSYELFDISSPMDMFGPGGRAKLSRYKNYLLGRR